MRKPAYRSALLACFYCCIGLLFAAELVGAAEAQAGRAEALFQEGLQQAAAGRTEAAVATFSRLTRDYPRLWQPYAQLAALYVRQGEPVKAIAPLQTALKLQADVPALQEQLGDLYVQLAADAYAAASPTRATAAEKAAGLKPRTNEVRKDDGSR